MYLSFSPFRSISSVAWCTYTLRITMFLGRSFFYLYIMSLCIPGNFLWSQVYLSDVNNITLVFFLLLFVCSYLVPFVFFQPTYITKMSFL
jgi:hypothetical protein